MTDVPPPTVPPATPPPPGGGSYTPPPPPPTGGAAPGSDRTMMIVLAYLWILALVPLLTKKDDAEVQWHAKNGLGILIGEVVCWIAFTIIGFAAPHIFGCGVSVISCVIWIGFLVVRILCIVKGTSGQRFVVPVLTDIGQKINF